MHSAKTFCVPQNFSLRPFLPPFAVAPLPFAARELTREMDNHHHRRNQDAHTKRQRQNRRSGIFQEDGGRTKPCFCRTGVGGSGHFAESGVTVTLSDVSRYGDVQVEIRTNGTLNWRAWSFEPDFLLN
jgi:hypothetical protein